MDRTTHVSTKMPQSTSLKDVGVGGDFLESSNIRNTPRYVAGRHAEESYFSRALDTDNIQSLDIRRDGQFPNVSPKGSDQYQEATSEALDALRGNRPDYGTRIIPKVDTWTGSKVSASQAQESAILQNELKDYQFGNNMENFRSDGGNLRTPFSGGPGTDSTQTSAWEGVGESFPVTSPEFNYEPSKSATFGLSSTDRGYDASAIAAQKRQELVESLKWHKFPA